jgi:DNA-directed RNA polymerase subunit RPC12/RpoP
MSEFQKCQKCGTTFTRIDRTGPSIDGMGDITRHADEKMCPCCGGRVIWVDDSGSPMSAYRRMGEVNRHMRLDCLWGIVALIGWLIFYYFYVK